MRLRSILCAVDFSHTSRAALRAAADLACAHGSRLTVLFVDDPMLVAAAKAAHDVRGSAASTEAALERFIGRTVHPLPAEVRAMVTSGTPVDEILTAARRQQADLIVIGTRGLGKVARMLLGSTTDRVLRRARVPVLAVPTGVTS
jgi:nucleotide-binding universal stress UspA family protein